MVSNPGRAPRSDGIVSQGHSGGEPQLDLEDSHEPRFDAGRYEQSLMELVGLALAGITSVVIFSRSASRAGFEGFNQDFISHFILYKPLFEESWWVYSFWYYLQGLVLVGGPIDEGVVVQAGMLLVGGLSFLKGVVLFAVLRAFAFSRVTAFMATLLLGTAMAFPTMGLDLNYYLGTLPPNVFHTATQLLANIMAVLAIVTMSAWFSCPARSTWLLMVLAGGLSAAAKPSLTPAWIGALTVLYLIFLWTENQHRLKLIGAYVIAVLAPVLTIAMGYLVTYTQATTRQRQVGLVPLEVWSTYSSNIPVDLLRSWAFPVAVLIVLVANQAIRLEWKFLAPAWIAALFAGTMHLLLAEINPDGTANLDGNLGWGLIAAGAPLYVVSAIVLRRQKVFAQAIPWIILMTQVVAAVVHQQSWLWSGSYI